MEKNKLPVQFQPGDSNPHIIYHHPSDTEVAIIDQIYIDNTSGGNVTFRIFYSVEGGGLSTSNAIIYDSSISANEVYRIENAGIVFAQRGSTLAVRSNSTSVTFTIFPRLSR